MNRITVLTIVIWLGAFASRADAQIIDWWSAEYPKTGAQSGTVIIRGKLKPPMGWKIIKIQSQWWKTGLEVKTFQHNYDQMTLEIGEAQITVGSSGDTFNAFLEVIITQEGTGIERTARTEERKAKSK